MPSGRAYTIPGHLPYNRTKADGDELTLAKCMTTSTSYTTSSKRSGAERSPAMAAENENTIFHSTGFHYVGLELGHRSHVRGEGLRRGHPQTSGTCNKNMTERRVVFS